MPRLPHDGPFRGPGDRGAGSMAGPEGMARILRRIKSCTHRQFLDDSRHVDTAQPASLNLPVPVDRPE